MAYPRLRPLHLASSLHQSKLKLYARLTTEDLIRSLEPGQIGALKTRPDGTIVDGHHRIEILRGRGVEVDQLPREIVYRKQGR
jgi:hypothetical protein